MGSFYAYDFIWDDVPSNIYGLKIINFGGAGVYSGYGSSNVEIFNQRVFKKAKPYYLGRTQSPVLEFPLTFGSETVLSAIDRNLISQWLFGATTHKKLQICQDDLADVYWNCFLTDPSPKYVGNLNYAFETRVVCDSPFAYSFPKTISGSFAGDEVIYYDLEFFNTSADADYLYPQIEFTLNSIGDSFSITNQDDDNREFAFVDLSPNETITIDNDLQTVVSSTGLLRLSDFNKNWLRFVPGLNRLSIISGIGTFDITYQNRFKVGG